MSECKYRAADGECLHEREFPYKEYCVDGPCPNYTSKTNYDCLISKTPEEMAGWLTEKIYCIDCPQEENCMLHGRSMDCRSMWLDWLKDPVEEEE